MRLADEFSGLERDLPADWVEATLVLEVEDDGLCERAAALLGPANPLRRGTSIRFATARRSSGIRPDGIRRLLRRLDAEGIRGRLRLVRAQEAPQGDQHRREGLRERWTRALGALPDDWSDIYAELRFDSTDYLERGALLVSPLNPASAGPATVRFRCAHHFGYGASPAMVARSLQRCDEEGITGAVEILRVLSDTDPVGTQGPVWRLAGRAV